MGLLDDAIREHLELKRLRGADPGDVARAEKEALDPVPRERQGDGSQLEQNVAPETIDEADLVDTKRTEGRRSDTTPEAAKPTESADLADDPGETAELDMHTLLNAKEGAAAAEQGDQDLLEWESPRESTRGLGAGTEPPAQAVGNEDPAGAPGESGDSRHA
jgi:hypothetical protein